MKRGTLLVLFAAVALLITAGTALAATRSCDGGRCTGTQKDDEITGSAGEDIILGEGGNDTVFGLEGNDGIKGGTGDDEVYGEDGNDKVKGSQGRDKVSGGPGDDVVRGGTHGKTNDGVRDVLDCGPGMDTVYYVRGQDEIKDCEILNPRNSATSLVGTVPTRARFRLASGVSPIKL